MQVILRPVFPTQWLSSALAAPSSSSPEAARKLRLEKQVRRDLSHLFERVRLRWYPRTVNVLTFYWLQTLRETYTPAHWEILQNELRLALRGGHSGVELQALQRAAEWAGLSGLAEQPRPARSESIPPFTSRNFEPSVPASQVFLETLLNDWLPERILERYGSRPADDWTAENGLEEAASCLEEILRTWTKVPGVGAVQALDLLQRRQPSPREEILLWRRKRQASLESLVRVPLRDASVADPKMREILNDVVLYLLGTTAPAPAASPGYAWLFPAPLGTNLPFDIAQQVSGFQLPEGYYGDRALFIPLQAWPPARPEDGLRPVSIRSTLLTPDGRIWQARRMQRDTESRPGIEYEAIGRIELLREEGALSLKAPLGLWPGEVSPQLNKSSEFELFNYHWHMQVIEGSEAEAFVYYRTVADGSGIQKVNVKDAQVAAPAEVERPWPWTRAS